MFGEDDPKVLGAQIRALREAAGLSQAELAKHARTNQQTVQRIESGQTMHSRALPRILRTLEYKEVSPGGPKFFTHLFKRRPDSPAVIPITLPESVRWQGKAGVLPARVPWLGKASPVVEAADPPGIDSQIPVFTAEQAVHGQISLRSDSLGFLNRPEFLYGSHLAYAFYTVGHQMVPEFEPGDLLLVDPGLPAIPNVSCVFCKNPGEDSTLLIRRLVSDTDAGWCVRQWNPLSECELRRSDWPACHRIIGKFSRR